MADSLLDNISRDMWAESRKIKGQHINLPCSIDGAKCDEDITNVFYEKYNPLYNSVPYDKDEMNVELKMIYLKEAIMIMLLQWQM